ncbi:hypothetical protein AB3X94_20905 [Paraburkholderia sp. BR10923]|uniref:hypothetical protein n=1 Tax=Paraburkholderia sp. BR10923 TaxID=3236992 RepID=UPI0034CFA054
MEIPLLSRATLEYPSRKFMVGCTMQFSQVWRVLREFPMLLIALSPTYYLEIQLVFDYIMEENFPVAYSASRDA